MRSEDMEDVAKKLALLPEGLAEKNIESWKNTFLRYQKFYKTEYNEWVFPVFDLVQKIENTEQANLFRAGTSLYSLLISTAEKHGMKDKEPFVSVFIERNIKPSISYWNDETKVIEQPLNPEDDWLFILQPFLDRLWNETRGKKES
jgi:hypothetical protein